MGTLHDPFEPAREPARTIYLAFQNEARLRKGRTLATWIEAERKAVHAAAGEYARAHGMHAPTLDEVQAAERYAMGSVDYGAKWAFGVERAMRSPAPTGTTSHCA